MESTDRVKITEWRCENCANVYAREEPPETCEACGAPDDQILSIKAEVIARIRLTSKYYGE